jgi:hypothetical protein
MSRSAERAGSPAAAAALDRVRLRTRWQEIPDVDEHFEVERTLGRGVYGKVVLVRAEALLRAASAGPRWTARPRRLAIASPDRRLP